VAYAQQQPPLPAYPTPRLTGVMPLGGKAGSTVELTLSGVDLEGADDLYFSHAAIKAERVSSPVVDPKKNPGPPPIKFLVSIPAATLPGSYDIRVNGKAGLSNPRTFVVSDLNEFVEKEPNNDVADAQAIGIGSVVSGVIAANVDVDYYSFVGKKGQRIVVHCAAAALDSKLQAQVSVHGPRNREIAAGKKPVDNDVVLDCLLPLDGEYQVRVCEFTYLSGGADFVYRLTITDGPWIDAAYPPVLQRPLTLPSPPGGEGGVRGATEVALYGKNLGGKPDPQMTLRGRPLEKTVVKLGIQDARDGLKRHDLMSPRLASLDGFSYRAGNANAVFMMASGQPVLLDNEDNDTRDKAQPLPLPCLVCGKIEKRGDRDFYSFDAKQGDVYCIEAYADRLQSPLDLSFQIRRLDNGQIVGLFDDNPEIPPVVDRFYTATDDPKTRFIVPADGKYELLIRSLMGDLQGGPNHIYCLSIRKEQPDFRLVLVSSQDGAGLTLRQGSSHDIQVVCFRQDDFKGEVTISAEGLPMGVSCVPQTIGPNLQQSALVLTAAANAPDWSGEVKITGTAIINGTKVIREAHGGCLVYPTAAANIAAVSRLSRSICLAVRSKGPFRLEALDAQLTAPAGGQVKTKLRVARQAPDYKDNVEVVCVGAPAQSNGKPVTVAKITIAPDKDGEVKFLVPENTPPGTYNLVFRGTGKLNVDINKKKVNVQFAAAAPPVRLTVFNSVVELAVSPQLSIKPGSETPLMVKVNRLNNFNGELKVDLVVPPGLNGVTSISGVIPAGASETRLLLKATKDAKVAVNPNFIVRASAKFDNLTLKSEQKVQVVIAKDAPVGAALTTFKSVTLLEEGSAVWKYVAASTVKGDAWRNLDFDDKKWQAAKTPFGNGEPEIKKRGGTQIPEAGVSLLCRRVVEIPADVLANKGLFVRLQVASDNSAVVYLNGALVDEDKADHEFSYWNREVSIDANMLRPGRNVLAVLLNNPNGSSDAYLDVAFTAQVPVLNAKK